MGAKLTVRDLIAEYLTSSRAEGKTKKTIQWHREALGQFAAWVEWEGVSQDPAAWSAGLLKGYVAYQQQRTQRGRGGEGKPLSGSTVNSWIRSLHAFRRWLEADGWVEADPFAKVKVPKAPKTVKESLSPAELGRMLEAARKLTRNARRNEALILFMADTGCREAEVCGLKLDRIDWEARIARVLGKGNKERFVPFGPITAAAMRRYHVRERRETGCDHFFVSEEGRPLTTSGLYQIVRRLGEHAGVHANPHKFRHTFAITSLRNGASVFAVQKMLGHETLDVTLRYSALVTSDLISEHQKCSPVAGMLRRERSTA